MMTRVRTKVKPAPVRSTVVLFDGGRRTRTPNFGRGLLAALPSAKLPCSVGDLEWAVGAFSSAAEIDAAEDRFNEILEMRYLESAMLDRYTAGHCL